MSETAAALAAWDALTELVRAAPVPPVDGDGEPLLTGRRVFRGSIPPDVELPRSYVLLGSPYEEDGGFFGEPGDEGVYMAHLWSDSPDNALRMWVWFKALTSGARPAMAGHSLWQGFGVRLLGLQPDADGANWQARVEVTASTEVV